MTLAEFLKQERERVGLSQTALAKAAGVPYLTLCALEQGHRRNPGISILQRLWRALGFDANEALECLTLPIRKGKVPA